MMPMKADITVIVIANASSAAATGRKNLRSREDFFAMIRTCRERIRLSITGAMFAWLRFVLSDAL